MNFDELFGRFDTIKVAVLGDVMLDTYCWGHVERISPEAPVPVVTLDKREYRIGGAGNVALNIASLGAPVSVFSIIGQDEDGKILQDLLESKRINASSLLKSGERITTNKTRIISRNQQMMRLDSETTRDLSGQEEERLLECLRNFIEAEAPQVIILEDYNKGILTSTLIEKVVDLSKRHEIVSAVDPKKKNFFSYKGVDIFKPNLKEVKEGLNLLAEEIDLPALQGIHRQLSEKLGHRISFITLSEKGVFFQDDRDSAIISSHVRNISDVSGAGDTVIAVASLIYAATRDVNLMAQVANIAGGLVCEQVGTAAIDRDRLLAECKLLLI